MQTATRTKRSAALKALEKISALAKEAEKYDDYGAEIESIDDTKDSIVDGKITINVKKEKKEEAASVPITPSNWSVQATDNARKAAAENAPKDTTTWPDDAAERANFAAQVAASKTTETSTEPAKEASKEPTKKTPNTLLCIPCDVKDEHMRAINRYTKSLKPIYSEEIKDYISVAESNDMKYFAVPEMIKYLITNPAMLLHHDKYRTTVVKKMDEFETQIATNKKIGSYEITDEYRRELLALIKILKKICGIYEKINLNHKSFYDNITSIADSL